MSFVHDVIKIKYAREGYLPNYPYHLISDEEMCEAFLIWPAVQPELDAMPTESALFGPTLEATAELHSGTEWWEDWFHSYVEDSRYMWFKDNYPLVDEAISDFYQELLNRLYYELQEFRNNLDDNRALPDWVYSYMLGIVIGPESDKVDIHDFITSMGVDNIEDDYTLDACIECLKISKTWLKKLIVPEGEVPRPPTMFGEPHVLKSIRLDEESLSPTDLPTN